MRRRISKVLHSVRFRLTLWYVALLALVLVAFSGTLYSIQQYQIQEALKRNLITQVADVVRVYNNQTGLLDISASDIPITSGNLVILLTPEGRVAQSFAPLPAEAMQRLVQMAMSVSQDMPPNGGGSSSHVLYDQRTDVSQNWLTGWAVAVVRIWMQHHVVALLVVAIPSTISLQLENLAFGLACTIPIILVLSAGSGYWLAHRTMRPIQNITHTARDISATDLHRRLRIARRDELGELGATIDAMLDRLEGAFQRQRQFTADASHELRTPLTIVNLQASRALEQPQTLEGYRQTLAVILQENTNMSRLVNDLLLLARADGHQGTSSSITVDLGEVVFEAVERLAPLAEQRQIAMTIAALPDVSLQGNRDNLIQLFTNVIENALKHSQGIARHVQIHAMVGQCGGKPVVTICVEDDGPGIAAEHLPHLFDRFYRVDRVRTQHPRPIGGDLPTAGSGLGLAIAQWIVQEHGGTIQVQSPLETGTIVTIVLPLNGPSSSEMFEIATCPE